MKRALSCSLTSKVSQKSGLTRLRTCTAHCIPGFATGINRVPHDMLARIHKDEAVVPAAYNPYNPGASAPGNSEVVAELRKLNERMARIEASSNATAGHTAGTDRKLARVIRNDAMITEALPA